MERIQVCIIDYCTGNPRSVFNAIRDLGALVKISNKDEDINAATHLVLPGVGAFSAAMNKLKKIGLIGILKKNVIEVKKPFLGICVGMQILADEGFEYGWHEGLGWMQGSVNRMEVGKLPLPHIGWNNLKLTNPSPMLDRIGNEVDFYFVHSYYFKPKDKTHINAVFEYGREFPAVVSKDNIFGVQFHPEKSQKAGRILFDNFLRIR